MKAFEFHVEPDEKDPTFTFVPTKEFKEVLDKKWMKELENKVTGSFDDTLSRYESGETLRTQKEEPVISADVSLSRNTVNAIVGTRDYVNRIRNTFDQDQTEIFEEAHSRLCKRIIMAVEDYLDVINSI